MNPIQNIAPVLASHAVNSLLLGVAISALVWVTLKVTFRTNSAARFAVLYSALLAIIALLFFHRSVGESALNARSSSSFTLSAKWAVSLLYVWAVVASAALMRIAAGLWRLHLLRRSFVLLDLPEIRYLIEQRHRLSRRRVETFHSSEIRVPAAIGFFHPAIVLPSWSLAELSPDELKTAIVHELAHVDRWDDWTNLAQKFIRALLFFHPAVWWLDSRLAIEREMSCDDVVLAQTSGAEQYAQCLISLAEKSFLKRPLSLAHAAVGHIKQLALRLGRIMDGKERKVASGWKPALAALTAFSAMGMVAVKHVPQLVAFQTANQPAAPIVAQSSSGIAPVILAGAHEPIVTHAKARKIYRIPISTQTTASTEANAYKNRDLLARRLQSNPSIINAGAKEQLSGEFMYVVMETRDYDGSGMVRITTSVWKLRLIMPSTMRAENAPPHST